MCFSVVSLLSFGVVLCVVWIIRCAFVRNSIIWEFLLFLCCNCHQKFCHSHIHILISLQSYFPYCTVYISTVLKQARLYINCYVSCFDVDPSFNPHCVNNHSLFLCFIHICCVWCWAVTTNVVTSVFMVYGLERTQSVNKK